MKLPITVLLTTYNEAHNIAAALDSVVDWANEIIVVDSFSTDETVSIAKNYGVTVWQRAYKGPADQKNWAIPQAQYDWILLMDADERTTPHMKAEIRTIVEADFQTAAFDCYWIGFRHYVMGQLVRYSGWQNDKTIRLIRRDLCRYNQNQVHEEIDTVRRTPLEEGGALGQNGRPLRVGHLKTKFEHYTFKNSQHFIAKQERYAAWSALDYEPRTGRILPGYHFFLKPLFRFFKHFILKRGFLDGRIGFIIAAIAAWTVFLRYVNIQEIRQERQQKY
jgi:glycosyltransferase involved in cell wall biosynthesis